MSALLDKGAAKYIALETFKRDGHAINTPVWITREGDRLYAITQADAWKVKRIRNNERVRLAESDARGTPEGSFVEGEARILTDAAAVKMQEQRIYKKYGLFARVFMGIRNLRKKQDTVVIEIRDLAIG